jgi:hypothetical protein
MPKRKYRVVSRQNSLGRPHGTVFEADLAKLGYNEADLIDRGSLERVSDSTKTEKGEPGVRAPIQGVTGGISASSSEESDSSDSSKS